MFVNRLPELLRQAFSFHQYHHHHHNLTAPLSKKGFFMKRVVITGMGTVNPLGCNLETFWNNVKQGKLGISTIDTFDTTEVEISVAGIVRDFDPAAHLDKKDIRHMERFTQFAVVAAKEALEDCGSDLKDLDPYRCGVIIGCGVGGLEMTQNSIKLSWSSEEVDEKLKSIMKNIHAACVQYGTEEDGYVNYVKGANVAGFMKVAKAMMAQGIL